MPVTINFFILLNRSFVDYFIPTCGYVCQRKSAHRFRPIFLIASPRSLSMARYFIASAVVFTFFGVTRIPFAPLTKIEDGFQCQSKVVAKKPLGSRQTWQMPSMMMASTLSKLPADVPGRSCQKRINTLSTFLTTKWGLIGAYFG